jgi:hypothetical protein
VGVTVNPSKNDTKPISAASRMPQLQVGKDYIRIWGELEARVSLPELSRPNSCAPTDTSIRRGPTARRNILSCRQSPYRPPWG